MRRTVVLLVVAVGVLLSQTAAAGGGWWTSIDVHDQFLGRGESLRVKVDEVLFDSIEAAEEAEQTQYFAYLVEDFDRRALDRAMSRRNPKDWWEPVGRVFQTGTVTFENRDANLTEGRVHLEVPEVPPGRYFLMLCDAGCRTPLANHIPVRVHIASDMLAAQTTRRLDRVNERLSLALAQVRRDVRRTERELRQAEASSAQAAEAAEEAAAPQPVPVTDRDTTPWSWIPYAGWFLAGAAVTLVLARRRLESRFPDIIINEVPDDARELTKTTAP